MNRVANYDTANPQEIVDLGWTWDQVRTVLGEMPGIDLKAMERFFQEGVEPRVKGIHFFAVQYKPGAVIMAKGAMSDYAAVHLSGLVHVRHAGPKKEATGLGCWDRATLRRLENLVLNATEQGPAQRRAGLWGLLAAGLASFYQRCPAIPLVMVDCSRRISPRWGECLENGIARLLRGQMKAVPRRERALAGPVPRDPSEARPMDRHDDSPVPVAAESDASAAPQQDQDITIRDENNKTLPVIQRLMGITSTLWNQPRSATLVAADDPDDGNAPCRMLLIKRKALLEVFKSPKGRALLDEKLRDFVATSLPSILAENRLFRDMVYKDDVQSWESLLDALRGAHAGSKTATEIRQRIASALDAELKTWLARRPTVPLSAADQTRVVSSLNKLLLKKGLAPDDLSEKAFAENVRDEAHRLLQSRRITTTLCETFRLNRLLLEVVCPGAVRCTPTPWPLFLDDFGTFAHDIASTHKELTGHALQPERFEKDLFVPKAGESEALYLVLSGMVRVIQKLPGGDAVSNHLEAGGYFGEKAIVGEEVASPTEPPAPRTSGVQTCCTSYVLRLEPSVLNRLGATARYKEFMEKLRHEQQRAQRRDRLVDAGGVLPQRGPTTAIADKLVLTRNILLIDMDVCTRCDQCVRGCAEAHDMQPRFHRANPSMRFDKWEVAGACMHCLDAPCLEACPVGAITFLEDKAVQIHRTRCIGCGGCERKCPFDVINMYPRTSLPDAPNLSPTYEPLTVANKCDLCLTDDYDPPCVASCPYDAAARVNPAEFFRGLKGRSSYAEQ